MPRPRRPVILGLVITDSSAGDAAEDGGEPSAEDGGEPPAEDVATSEPVDGAVGAGPDRRVAEQREPRRPRSATVAWPVLALAAVAVVAIALAAVFFLQWQELRVREDARLEAADVASLVAAQVTTFRGEDIEAFVAATQALATERYGDEVADLFDARLRGALRDQEVESVGAVLDVFVQDVQGDVANAFVVVRQAYTSAALLNDDGTRRAIEDDLQMEVTLVRTGERWLADDVRVLGDPILTPVPAPGPEGDAAATEGG